MLNSGRRKRRAAIGVLRGAGAERAADPFLAGAGHDRHLLRSLTSFLLAQLGEENRFELRDRDDFSRHVSNPSLVRSRSGETLGNGI
ncbi:MAG: hypothetical protein ACREFL_12775 [Stellaceae bacterium]